MTTNGSPLMFHLEVPDPDPDSKDLMPIFDRYNFDWLEIVFELHRELEPGTYRAIRTLIVGDTDELIFHGLIEIDEAGTVTWKESADA